MQQHCYFLFYFTYLSLQNMYTFIFTGTSVICFMTDTLLLALIVIVKRGLACCRGGCWKRLLVSWPLHICILPRRNWCLDSGAERIYFQRTALRSFWAKLKRQVDCSQDLAGASWDIHVSLWGMYFDLVSYPKLVWMYARQDQYFWLSYVKVPNLRFKKLIFSVQCFKSNWTYKFKGEKILTFNIMVSVLARNCFVSNMCWCTDGEVGYLSVCIHLIDCSDSVVVLLDVAMWGFVCLFVFFSCELRRKSLASL